MLGNPILLLTGCIIAIVPIFDMLLGIVRRLVARRPIFQGDRGHFYDRMNATIGDPSTTVLWTYLISAIAATWAILASWLPAGVDVVCLSLLVALAAISSYKLGWLRYET
jgi:UDP-N-acetylmuramyl pentapeptide phosphotransferase/UDP-N-acetylglucosamine-1-phosphate transferase